MKVRTKDWIITSVLTVGCVGLLLFLLVHTEPEISLSGTIEPTEGQRRLATILEPVFQVFITPVALIDYPLVLLDVHLYGRAQLALMLFAPLFWGFGPYFVTRYLLHRCSSNEGRSPA